MTERGKVIHVELLLPRILVIRGQRVILDSDLAALYGVTTRRLNEQLRRNRERFPADFAFQLTKMEKMEVVANCDHLEKIKYSQWLPYAFTEHGAIMAANVVNSSRAIEMSVFVVRAFVQMRESLSFSAEIAAKLDDLESRVDSQDNAITTIVKTIRTLTAPAPSPSRKIGFRITDGAE